jgi:hypothetical protein
MSEIQKVWNADFSRRCLLRAAPGAVGALALLVGTANQARAAQMPQSSVAYQSSPHGDQRCDNCTLFEAPSSCKSVAGKISPKGWCRIYRKK